MKIPGTSAEGPTDIFKLNEIIDNARIIMLNTGSMEPVFFMKLSSEEKMRCYPIPTALFNSAEGKDAISATIHNLVEQNKPDSLVFLSEAWVKAFKVDDAADESYLSQDELKAKANKHIDDINKSGGLSALPRKEKDQVIMISACDYTKTPTESYTGFVRVLRDSNNEVANFNEPEWIKANIGISAQGRFNFG